MEKPNFEQFQKGYVAPATPEAFDTKWFVRLEDVIFDDYEQLAGDNRDAAKQAFLKGEVDNPQLDYPKLESFNIEEREKKLVELKQEILAHEQNEVIQKVYRAKINEMLAQLRMLKAAKEGNDRTFKRYSEFIYGTPAPEHMGYVSSVFKTRAEKVLASGDDEQKAAARRILNVLQNTAAHESDMVGPEILIDKEDVSVPVQSMGEIVHEVWQELQNKGVYDWDVALTPNTAFSASQETKTINIPEKTADKIAAGKFSSQQLAGLIAHEVRTHAVRRARGERSKLRLLGIGLDRYLAGEEGVATYREQQVEGTSEFAGLGHYFNIGIATGFFDGEPRDFRKTFELVRDYKIMTMKKSDERYNKASDSAWTSCVRIFRGTTCATPGAVFTKDLAYMGNREIWTLVSKNSDAVMTFDLGKFDPTRKDHIAVLSQLGILDNEL